MNKHRNDLLHNCHHSYKLQNDFNITNDMSNFVFDVIEETNCTKIDLLQKEQTYIDLFDSYNNGYNCCEYSVNPKYAGIRATNICSKNVFPNYVKIPREIIYDKELGNKRVIIFSYLCARRALDDTVAFSTTEMCHWSNLKPNYRDGKINQKYYEVLLLLSHHGYFVECPDFKSCLHESTNSVKYQKVKLNIEKFDTPDNFGIIYFDELQRILDFKGELKDSGIDLSRMSSAYILLLLSYLRVNMNRNTDKPLCCYRHYQKIAEDTGLSERYIGRIVEILDKMDIVKFQKMQRTMYKDSNGEIRFTTTPKVFADYRHFIKTDNGYSILDNGYDYNAEIAKQIKSMKKENITT